MISGLFNSIAQTQQQRASYENQQAQIEIGKRKADDEYRMRVANAIMVMQQADAAQQQATDAAVQSKSEIAREMFRAREAAKASASAAGVAGNTLNRIAADISFTEQQKLAVEDINKNHMLADQQMQKQNAIQATKMSPFYYTEASKPSYFNSMFSIIPSLLGNLNFSGFSCGTQASTASTCSVPTATPTSTAKTYNNVSSTKSVGW